MKTTHARLVGVERADQFVRDAVTGNGFRVVVGVDGAGRSAVLAAIVEAVDRLVVREDFDAAPSGSVLIVDDLHLAAEHIFDEIASAATRSDISVVVATAPRRFDSRVEKLMSAAGSQRLALHPLNKASIAARAAATTRPLSVALAGAISKTTGGNLTAVDAVLSALAADRADTPPLRVVTEAAAAHHHRVVSMLPDDVRSLLLAARFGITPAPETAIRILTPGASVESVVDQACASGLLDPTGVLIPSVVPVLAEVVGTQRIRSLLACITEVGLRSRVLDATAAGALAEQGVVHAELADFLVQQADSATIDHAAALYGAAVKAGVSASVVAARRSEVAAAAGELDDATHFADAVLESGDADPRDLRTAVRVSATVAAERGMAMRSAQLYAWLGLDRAGPDAALAALAAATVGDRSAASAAVTAMGALPPTSSTASGTLLVTGVIESIDSRTTLQANAAAHSLMRAVTLSSNGTDRTCAPDTAAAVATIHALHSGDLNRVDSILLRASANERPGTATHTRLNLIGAWASMLRGDAGEATRVIDALVVPSGHVRNQFYLHGLRVGVARRSGDAGSLISAWADAQNVITEYSIDLFSLLPLGELLLAGTRLGQVDRVEHLVSQATTLLADLQDPPIWASALHWYHVQAAILAQTPEALVPHARALAAAAPTHPYSAALAAAGRAWLGVLQGRPDAVAVESSARTLTAFGLPWDGARLASEAALSVSDTATATALLHIARSLRQPSVSVVGTPAGEKPQPSGALSDREAEVAELLVLGVTYREVGSRLYISPKTVEHHVARIRRRLGAESRSELISMLRAMGYGNQ